jgi:hypothetical protein
MNTLSFQNKIEQLINETSQENESNTPDFILAEFLYSCLVTFNKGIKQRDKWYGMNPIPGTNWKNDLIK